MIKNTPVANVFVTVRLLYFLHFVAFGVFVTFADLYFRGIGYSGVQIGTINSLIALVGIIAGPVWGMLSDRAGVVRPYLAMATAGSALLALAIYLAPSFVWVLPIVALFAFFRQPLMPLLDAATLQLLAKQPEMYGRQRVWGTLGFIVSAWGFGYLLTIIDLDWLFAGFIGALLLMLLFIRGLPRAGGTVAPFAADGIRQIVRDGKWRLFMASIFVLGMGNSAVVHFLGIYLTELGASRALIGGAAGLGALAELPVMFWGANLIRRFGAWDMLLLAYLAAAVRWLAYGLMNAPEWAIPIGLLNSLTFGVYWVAGVSLVNQLAPDGLKATAQGLFYATFGLANVIGSLINGYVFDLLGAAWLFRLSALFALLACVFLFGIGRPARRGQSLG